MGKLKALSRNFYMRDLEIVAKELLGKRLIRRLNGVSLGGIIVETEAYYGLDDPASRAYHGIKDYNSPMLGEPGRTFIYNVHRYWMLNIVAHEQNKIGAVLIRSRRLTRMTCVLSSIEIIELQSAAIALHGLTSIGDGNVLTHERS